LGRPAEALPYIRRATEIGNVPAATWANLGTCYSLLGQHAPAIAAFTYAVQHGDARPQLVLSLAESHVKLGQYAPALEVLQPLARTQPNAAVYERMGYAQFKLQKYDAALANYRAALSFQANDTASLNGLGVCLMTLYIQGDRANPALRDEALATWRKSLQRNPAQPRIVDLLSRYQKL